MALLETLANMINKDSSHFVQFGIPAERVQDVQYDATPVSGGSGYFRIWAVEMKVSEGGPLANFYPVLHSVVRFDYAGSPVELTRVTSLDALKSSVGSSIEVSKVIALNFPLTELVPFSGGNVEITAGLLAMKERDKVQAAIKMATDISALLAVPQLSTVLSLAQPLAKNIESIVGLGDSQFRLGFHNTFTGAGGGGSNDLKSQYIAVIAAQEKDNVSRDGAGHWVINDHLVYIDPTKGQGEVPRDYMLLRVEVRRSRGDEWNKLPSLNTPFAEALKTVLTDKITSKAQLKAAILAVLQSPDVAENDREPIALQLRDKYNRRYELLAVEAPPSEEEEAELNKLQTLGGALEDLPAPTPGANQPSKPMTTSQLLDV